MADPEEAPEAAGELWVCEYCGANRNTANQNSCGICGSRRAPAFIRRVAGRAGAARLLADHYGIVRGDFGDDDDEMFEEDGLEIQFREGMMGMDDEEQVAALALEVAGVAGAARIPGALSRRRRFQMGPAIPEPEDRDSAQPTEPPETLWRLAMENAASYQPKWGTTTQHRGRIRTGYDVEIGTGQLQNVARMMDGVAEGRAIRASEPLPRPSHRSQREHNDSPGQDERQRKVYGFRVVFDHPYRDPGMSLGDCYLVGLTTSSFSQFGDRNGLLQSPHFWGIEDGGSYFEGARRRRGARPGAPSSGYGMETSAREAPRNVDNVLFGSQETVTVVVDLENATMSFWRDGDFIGTLVRNLPRSGYLYPVVVPFNPGVTFAITAMDGSPLPCVKNFNALRKERQDEWKNRRRQELAEQKCALIQNGKLSPAVISVLKNIFCSYADRSECASASEPLLDIVTASRLFYRSGLMLSELAILAEEKAAETFEGAVHDTFISAEDYIECISSVVEEEEAVSVESFEVGPATYEIGDKVELVETYAKFGDAVDGPLQPGDRGTLLEVKEGHSGEVYAVNVSFNANQWWYHPQALRTERSGLIESSSVWFLHKTLRSHGYDHTTLELLWGKPLNSTSWEVGDLVVPLARSQKNDMSEGDMSSEAPDCFGRIAAETKDPSSSPRSRSRKSDTVLVEFIDPAFGRAVGVMNALEEASDSAVEVRRVPIDKLQHHSGGFIQGAAFKADSYATKDPVLDTKVHAETCLHGGRSIDSPKAASIVINSRLRSEIEGISCLDPTSIQSVAKACEKQPSLCNSAFSSGLCDAILSAVSLAEQSAKKGKVNDRMGVAVSSLGLLSSILCKGLLSVDNEEAASYAEDSEMYEEDDEYWNLSAVLTEASLPVYDGSAVTSEGRRSSNAARSDPLGTLAARHIGGPLFRARARHNNSTGPRSPRDELNIDGEAHADTRVAVTNGLLRNSLPWLEACLQLPDDRSKAKAGSESLLSRITNARDEHGMSLLLLAITFGCSKEIVHRLIHSEAIISKTEIAAAAVSNQPSLLSVLLQHSVCPKQGMESLQVSPEVAAVFREAESRQKIQDQALRRKAESFLSTLIVSLCHLASTCHHRSVRVQRFGRAVTEALVGNVLLRALFENQRKASATSSPRRRKHGSSTQLMSDDSERLSLSLGGAPWSTGDSEVFASASAMSPNHGILLGLPVNFFSSDGFLDGLPLECHGRLSVVLSLVESLLWSNDVASIAAGLTTLHKLLKGITLSDLSFEIERYGLRELMSAHELIAGRQLAEIKDRLDNSKASETKSEVATDGSRANKKRPRQHLAASSPNSSDGIVLCPKSHVAELHLTKHSSFRCDLCGKGVLRDRPMHGCRECDWDACETCTDKVEGGIVKWGHILELAVACRKLLDDTEEGHASMDDADGMKIDEPLGCSTKISACPDFSTLARHLRLRKESALEELATKMESSDQMTNHEFVTYVLPALHSALMGVHGVTGNGQFCLKALEHLTDHVESSASVDARGNDDMSVEEVGQDGDSAMVDSHGQEPMVLANRVSSIALRRMQDILSFSENMSVRHVLWDKKRNGTHMSLNGSRLKSLTKPIQLVLSPWRPLHAYPSTVVVRDTTVFVEPLVPSTELERHVIRAGTIENEAYLSFCRSLATGNAVIVERSTQIAKGDPWRIAQVIDFDDYTGAHSVRYPSKLTGVKRNAKSVPVESLKFDGEEAMLLLAARDYVILRRTEHYHPRRAKTGKAAAEALHNEDKDGDPAASTAESIPVGIRVEVNCFGSDMSSWLPCTVVGLSAQRNENRYDVVSDSGEVLRDIGQNQIRGYQSSANADGNRNDSELYRNLRDSLDAEPARNTLRRSGSLPFPFFRLGRSVPDQRMGELSRTESRPFPESGILKRSWSAISPLNEMNPIVIPVPESEESDTKQSTVEMDANTWNCSIDDALVIVSAGSSSVEFPPKLSVKFTAHESLPPDGACSGETAIHMLHRLFQRHDDTRDDSGLLRSKHHLYYSVQCETGPGGDLKAPARMLHDVKESAAAHPRELPPGDIVVGKLKLDGRRKTLSEESFDSEFLGVSESLNSTSLQCMEVMNILASCAEEADEHFRENRPNLSDDSLERLDERAGDLLSSFENESLSQKLTSQLEDPLMVVSGVLPEWCLSAPSLAPRVFSYASRRQLLFRTAFGVSRSTLKQQEAKVAVGPLRQRMAVLRGRAVELMGEAFSGGAEDPTVLQLQADELYGMEEALASRVTAAFRAQRWEERSLQVVKAVVRREMLLIDTINLMERYASDERLCHRRLEVRFEGESGFDAASGTEAGVTRGFYADVAEALISSEHVSPLNCPVSCLDAADMQAKDQSISNVECRLPLWIPDMDSSHQVVIPTPRASPNSTLGVYPRPLLPYDTLLPLVLERFRFIGRLFAAAMRDGLMFPLQLSTSFLKLVQLSSDTSSVAAAAVPPFDGNVIGSSFVGSHSSQASRAISLTSDDLPRPGFLGGEVYAVEKYICSALDRIDKAEPPLSPLEADHERQKIASDPQFARVALGKSYDCSFEEYFDGRVFVDPLSPTQGEDAAPLCPNGHLQQVNIHNIREWVHLAKQFILHDGVIEQARAFRQGVDDFFSSDYLRIFTAFELQRDVCGGGDKVDRWTEEDIKALFKFDGGRGVTEALVAVAAMGGEGGASLNRRFGASSPTIGFLVRTLLESSTTQRRQLLSFVTSVPIVTPGKIEVVPMVSPAGEFLPMREGCLPRANTCARRLYLPRVEDYETFKQVLHAVIREESKFKGFYEWRG